MLECLTIPVISTVPFDISSCQTQLYYWLNESCDNTSPISGIWGRIGCKQTLLLSHRSREKMNHVTIYGKMWGLYKTYVNKKKYEKTDVYYSRKYQILSSLIQQKETRFAITSFNSQTDLQITLHNILTNSSIQINIKPQINFTGKTLWWDMNV